MLTLVMLQYKAKSFEKAMSERTAPSCLERLRFIISCMLKKVMS